MAVSAVSTHPNRSEDGFTLVELLIVIVILGILATVTVFAVRGITDKGQTSACSTEKQTLGTAIEAYFAQFGGTVISHSTGTVTSAAPYGPFSVATQAVPTGATFTIGATPADTLLNTKLIRALPTKFVVRDTGQLVYSSTTADSTGCIPSGSSSGGLVP